MKVIASSSGGKDSTFALFKAAQIGHEIVYLANTISDDFKRVRFHGVKDEVIQKQAQALGLPILQKTTSAKNYRKDYIENIKRVVEKERISGACPSTAGVEGLVLGDIFLEDCYEWAEGVCKELGLKLIEPLWKIDPEKLFREFVESGFEAVVVSTQANILDESWVGRKLDLDFLKDIKKLKNVDICGENGEYHSLVLNGPNFKKGLEIKKSQKVKIKDYWFLDIQEII